MVDTIVRRLRIWSSLTQQEYTIIPFPRRPYFTEGIVWMEFRERYYLAEHRFVFLKRWKFGRGGISIGRRLFLCVHATGY